MILRRVIEHFKKQEWTAIAIDFVIVVLGVFVGMQVNNWNAALQRKADERAILVRLQTESEEDVKFWSREVYVFRKGIANQRILLDALSAGAMAQDKREAVEDGLLRVSHYPAETAPHSVYDEVIASGGLGLIADLDARAAITAYVTETDFIDGQLLQFRGAALPVYAAAMKGRVFSAYAPERASLRRFDFDFAEISRDRQFVSDIVDLVRDQLQFQTYRERALKAAVGMCEAVSKAASKPCEVSDLDLEDVAARDGVNQ